MLGDDVDGPAVNGRAGDRVAAIVELLQPSEFRGMKIGGVDLRELEFKKQKHKEPNSRRKHSCIASEFGRCHNEM